MHCLFVQLSIARHHDSMSQLRQKKTCAGRVLCWVLGGLGAGCWAASYACACIAYCMSNVHIAYCMSMSIVRGAGCLVVYVHVSEVAYLLYGMSCLLDCWAAWLLGVGLLT